MFLSSKSRDARNRSRQQLKTLTNEETTLLNNVKKKQAQIEENKKQMLSNYEKQQKELYKEKLKQIKNIEKQNRELQMKANKENNMKNNKLYQNLKRDINSELRKLRNEALSSVLQHFDTEQFNEELQENLMALNNPSESSSSTNQTENNSLIDLLSNIPNMCELYNISEDDVTKLMDVLNSIYAYHKLLNISNAVINEMTFEHFVKKTLQIKIDNFQNLIKETDSATVENIKSEENTSDTVNQIENGNMQCNDSLMSVDGNDNSIVVDNNTLETTHDESTIAIYNNDNNSMIVDDAVNSTLNESVIDIQHEDNAMDISKQSGDQEGSDGEGEAEADFEVMQVEHSTQTKKEGGYKPRGRPPKNGKTNLAKKNAEVAVNVSEQNDIELDTIQLNSLSVLLSDVYAIFDGSSDSAALTNASSSQDKKNKNKAVASTTVTKSNDLALPLNQLTWMEYLRWLIIAYICKEMNKPDEEVPTLI